MPIPDTVKSLPSYNRPAWPIYKKVAFVTLIAVVSTSVLNVFFWCTFFGFEWPYVLAASIATPIVIAPPISYWNERQRRQLRAAHQEISRLVYTDDLTGLHNRRYLSEIAMGDHGTQLQQGPGCVLIIDIDRFKDINDNHGHAIGDKVIVQTARILQSACRASDKVFRVGGEEFCLYLAGASDRMGQQIAERIREDIASTCMVETKTPVSCSVSIGISRKRQGMDLYEAMEIADKALYSAKQSGRNRTEFSTERAA